MIGVLADVALLVGVVAGGLLIVLGGGIARATAQLGSTSFAGVLCVLGVGTVAIGGGLFVG